MKIILVVLLAIAAAAQSAAPVLLTSLATVANGQLKGAKFGERRGKVFAVGRFDMSKLCNTDDAAGRSQWLQMYDCKPKGDEVQLPDEAIANWSNATITIAWPSAKKKTAFAENLRASSDAGGAIASEWPLVSAEYLVEAADGTRSALK